MLSAVIRSSASILAFVRNAAILLGSRALDACLWVLPSGNGTSHEGAATLRTCAVMSMLRFDVESAPEPPRETAPPSEAATAAVDAPDRVPPIDLDATDLYLNREL